MIHLITYGNSQYTNSKKRLYKEGLESSWFESISLYGPEDLDLDFKTKYKKILKQPRIAGYGIWRPYLILKKLKELHDNDILIYLDSGCTINKLAKKRFNEYIDMLKNSDQCIISFQMSFFPEKKYTTKEIFEYFNIDSNSEIANSGQILDGVLIMKKNKKLIEMINKWYDVIDYNPLLFTDYYNKNQNNYFVDNRHEQSIFSIIRKLNGSVLLSDETWFEKFGEGKSLEYPFWATRIKDYK